MQELDWKVVGGIVRDASLIVGAGLVSVVLPMYYTIRCIQARLAQEEDE